MDKTQLQHYRHLKKEASELASLITDLELQLAYPKTAQKKLLEEKTIRLMALKDRYVVSQNKSLKLASDIEAAIDRLQDPRERRVLRLCYLKLMPMEAIAQQTRYSIAQVYRLRDRGLDQL